MASASRATRGSTSVETAPETRLAKRAPTLARAVSMRLDLAEGSERARSMATCEGFKVVLVVEERG